MNALFGDQLASKIVMLTLLLSARAFVSRSYVLLGVQEVRVQIPAARPNSSTIYVPISFWNAVLESARSPFR